MRIEARPTRELIVSRYRETLSWLARVPADIAVTVYDKGSDVSPLPDAGRPFRRVPSPNVGREAHAILSHFAGRYDDLADWTFTAQGHPFDHSPDLIGRLDAPYRDAASLCRACVQGPPVVPWPRPDDIVERIGPFEARYAVHPEAAAMLASWPDVFACPPPATLHFGFAGMWAVPRRRVTQRPRRFWERLLRGIERPGSGIDAWTMEAFWCYIFADPIRYPHRMEDRA